MAFRAGLKDPIFKKLCKIAAIGGFITIGAGFYFESKIRRDIVNSPFFQQSLKILHQNENLIKYLGPPVGIGKVDLGQKDIFASRTNAQLHLPISGCHHKGRLYLWASRSDSASTDWTVDRLEVSVDDQPGKRILVHLHTEPSSNDISVPFHEDSNSSSF